MTKKKDVREQAIKEQEPEEEPCPEGQKRNAEGKCVPISKEQEEEPEPNCPPNQHYDKASGKCVDDEKGLETLINRLVQMPFIQIQPKTGTPIITDRKAFEKEVTEWLGTLSLKEDIHISAEFLKGSLTETTCKKTGEPLWVLKRNGLKDLHTLIEKCMVAAGRLESMERTTTEAIGVAVTSLKLVEKVTILLKEITADNDRLAEAVRQGLVIHEWYDQKIDRLKEQFETLARHIKPDFKAAVQKPEDAPSEELVETRS